MTTAFDGMTYLSSGMVAKGQTFDVKFPTAGSYRFVCIIHPGMESTVQVVAASGIASTQAQLDTAAQEAYGDTLTALKAEAAKQTAQVSPPKTGDAGLLRPGWASTQQWVAATAVTLLLVLGARAVTAKRPQ